MNKLLPCPFCGQPACEYENGEVSCNNKKCPVRPAAYSVEAWNTRHTEDSLAIEIEKNSALFLSLIKNGYEYIPENDYGSVHETAKFQYGRYIRTKDKDAKEGIRPKTRTHNIELCDNEIWWENNNSKSWTIQFSKCEEAALVYWMVTTLAPIKKS